jgi:hypothetical protein
MSHTVDTQTINKLIKNIGDQLNPTASIESLKILEQWIVGPILILEPEQRTLIKQIMCSPQNEELRG